MTARASTRQHRLWTTQTWPFIASVLALMTFIAFESFAVTTILPVAVADLGDIGWYSFAYAATITTALVGMVVGGNWADRAGPRTPLMVGGTIFLLGVMLNVLAWDVPVFIIGRLLQGLGGGIDSVILYVLIARHIPEAVRPQMFGLLTSAWLVPSLAGPVVAGAMAELMDWRAVFGVVLLGAAVSLLCLLHATRPSREAAASRRASSPRSLSAGIVGRKGALAVLAAGLLAALHLSGQSDGPGSAVIVGGVSLALLLTARSLLPKGTFTLRGAPQRLIALRAVLGATATATDLYLTLYLQTVRGYPPTTAGLVIAAAAGGWALGAWIQGRCPSTQTSHRRLVLIATMLVGTGPAAVLVYIVTDIPLWNVVIASVAMGTGMGTAYPRLSSAALALADPGEQGAVSSALQTGESMGIGVVTALIAAVLVSGGSFPAAYVMLIGLASAATVIASLGIGRPADTS
ncbi:MFS transporter [Nesterenkonia sp. PF2B19]|uniref:MFS transporter n=1 Tax=Nesterenkonia sp. PF2B19 TaxID=1881858 RepID=UPI000871B9A5|nr:MFS transporter [Nesterenkonia sp. PF2B19]